MTGAVEGSRQTKSPPRIDRLRGLSGKVLALAILFVMIGELLIFMPSLANYRVSWLKGRIAMAEVAARSRRPRTTGSPMICARSSCRPPAWRYWP